MIFCIAKADVIFTSEGESGMIRLEILLDQKIQQVEKQLEESKMCDKDHS